MQHSFFSENYDIKCNEQTRNKRCNFNKWIINMNNACVLNSAL